MPDSSNKIDSLRKRHFWEVAVRHMSHLRAKGYPSSASNFADRCADILGETERLQNELLEEWDGVEYDTFVGLEERRRRYHKEERDKKVRSLNSYAAEIPQGDPQKVISLSEVESSITRQMVCKAVHDTSRWQYRDPSKVREESSVELYVYTLRAGEIEELSRRALQAAKQKVALEVLDQVRHYLNRHPIYEANPKTTLGSPSEIAEAVQEKHAEKPRARRVDIAMEEYELDDSYSGKTDERSVRKALQEWFRRRAKKRGEQG